MRDGGRAARNGRARGTSRAGAQPERAPRDWSADAERFAAALDDAQLDALARDLGALPEALRAIGTGWATADDLAALRAGGGEGWTRAAGAYTTPERERDGAGRVTGLALRTPSRVKGFPADARRGLVVPRGLAERRDPVLVVEGASDVAALLSLGLAAVGRPSNTGGAEDLAKLLREREVLIVGERDQKPDGRWPGREGAVHIAKALARAWRKPVRWMLPPEGSKDVREWLRARIAAGLDLGDGGARRVAGEELLAALRGAAEDVLPPLTVRLSSRETYGRHVGTLAIGEKGDAVSGDDVLHTGRMRIAESTDRATWLGEAVEAAVSRASWLGDPDTARERIAELLDEAIRTAAAEELDGRKADDQSQVTAFSGDSAGRPSILWHSLGNDTPLHVLAPQAVEALAERCKDSIYVRGNTLVRTTREAMPEIQGVQRGAGLRVANVPDGILRELLDAAASWKEIKKGHGGSSVEFETWSPKAVVAVIRDLGEWPGLRPLLGVVEAPTLRPDGSVLDVPGYDTATGLLYHPTQEYPSIPARPTSEEVRSAFRSLLEPFREFEFETKADRASLAAFELTVAARPAIGGPVPHWAVMAPTFGAGKSLLVLAAALAMTGVDPDVMAPVGGRNNDAEAEMRKRITTLVLEAPRVAMIDNIPDGSTFESKAFAALLTTDRWTDRVLGRNEKISLPHHIVWASTGCNYRLWGDLARRSLSIVIDPGVEDPHLRTFEIPDLLGHVRREHPRLLAAALTVLRGFVEAGRPSHGLLPLGRFEAWDGLIRGAVIWASGLAGEALDPLDTAARLQDEAPDRSGLAELLAAWTAAFPGGAPATAREAVERAQSNPRLGEAIVGAGGAKKGEPEARALGNRLRVVEGRFVGGAAFRNAGKRQGAVLWRVVEAGFRESCESGESLDPSPESPGNLPSGRALAPTRESFHAETHGTHQTHQTHETHDRRASDPEEGGGVPEVQRDGTDEPDSYAKEEREAIQAEGEGAGQRHDDDGPLPPREQVETAETPGTAVGAGREVD